MADDNEETKTAPANKNANSGKQVLQEESQVVCPDCQVEMEDLGDRWQCPFCGFTVWKHKDLSDDVVGKEPDTESF